jgi:hypothetical protein
MFLASFIFTIVILLAMFNTFGLDGYEDRIIYEFERG